MIIKKEFKEVGEPTDCAPMDFVLAVQEQLEIFQHTTPEIMQDRMKRLFESNNRFEYTVTDDEGNTLAIMAITCDDEEAHIGLPVLVPMMACSLKPGLLIGAYRWLYVLAREHGIEWILTSKTEGHSIITNYRKIDLDQ